MPSFDIVSQVNEQELDNAVNQARKEIGTRYDFRGSKTEIMVEKGLVKLLSDDEYKMKAVQDILQSKAVRRGIDLKALSFGKVEPAQGGLVKCEVGVVQGISQEIGKKIVKAIKESGIKVQGQIQENQVRVSGKKRDDLQACIALIKQKDFGIPLQYQNLRD